MQFAKASFILQCPFLHKVLLMNVKGVRVNPWKQIDEGIPKDMCKTRKGEILTNVSGVQKSKDKCRPH